MAVQELLRKSVHCTARALFVYTWVTDALDRRAMQPGKPPALVDTLPLGLYQLWSESLLI